MQAFPFLARLFILVDANVHLLSHDSEDKRRHFLFVWLFCFVIFPVQCSDIVQYSHCQSTHLTPPCSASRLLFSVSHFSSGFWLSLSSLWISTYSIWSAKWPQSDPEVTNGASPRPLCAAQRRGAPSSWSHYKLTRKILIMWQEPWLKIEQCKL